MDTLYVAKKLELKLTQARLMRERTRREFEVESNMPRDGGPHPCSGLAIRSSGRRYRKAVRIAQKALDDHINFIAKGLVPRDLDSDLEIDD